MSESEPDESTESPYGAGVTPHDLEPASDSPVKESDEAGDAEAEKRRRSTIARLSETP